MNMNLSVSRIKKLWRILNTLLSTTDDRYKKRNNR